MNEQSLKEQPTTQRPVPTRVKWRIPVWIMTGRIDPNVRHDSHASGRVDTRSSVPRK